jgi:GT2 family glycosyltransferase
VLEPSVDALLAQALASLDIDPVGARLRLAAAIDRGVDKSVVTAMLAKSMALDDAAAALDLLKSAIAQDPQSLALWSQYWQVLANDAQASGSLCEHENWQVTLAHRLCWLDQGAELRAILKLLGVMDIQTNTASPTPRYLGYCRWDAMREVIEGWALDRWAIEEACPLIIERVDAAGLQERRQGHMVADNPVPWLAKAGISSVGGFVIRVPVTKDPLSIDALSLRFADGQPVGSPLACAPMIQVLTDQTDSSSNLLTNQSSVVDVLVPVYEGREHVLACIDSLINARQQQATPHEIVVLDDASQDPVLVQALQNLSDQGEIVLVRRPANLGFIRNINRGMALHTDRDVVWLNADTRVTGNWLDRLRATAYASDDTASATPWSNDGEFMTLAGKGNAEPMPSPEAQQQIDAIIGELDLPPEELVAGCGFCFYVKREAISQVGYLDEVHLIDGYGEETDWCMRARELGWRHVAATNLFVGHAGGQSFGQRKRALATHNNAIILQRYPLAERLHDDYLQQDPLKPAREKIARARFEHRERAKSPMRSNNPTVSIKREVSVAPKKRSQEWQQALAAASDHDIQLVWQITGTDTLVTLSLNGMHPMLQLSYRLPHDSEQLERDLSSLRADLNQNQVVSSADTRHMPNVLRQLLCNTLGIIESHEIIRAYPNPTPIPTPLKKQTGLDNSPTSHGLALIVDDLQVAEVVDAWLKALRATDHKPDGIWFVTTQNTPGAQLLRRTGQVAPISCPEGLTWKQWLGLLNVTCAVTLVPETAFIDEINAEFDLDLPLVDARALIPTHDLHAVLA